MEALKKRDAIYERPFTSGVTLLGKGIQENVTVRDDGSCRKVHKLA